MSTEDKAAPEAGAAKADEAAEVKVGDIIGGQSQPDADKDQPRMVPESAFLEEKKERKALTKEVQRLTKLIGKGASDEDVTQTIDEIAEEHNLDKTVVSKVAKRIRAEVDSKSSEAIDKRLKPIEESMKEKQVRELFDTHFGKAMESFSDLKGVVKKEVIFSLARLSENANKTLSQIIEDTYGGLETGTKTIDKSNTRRGTDTSTTLDLDRLKNDESYIDEIKANPVLKKQHEDLLMEYMKR